MNDPLRDPDYPDRPQHPDFWRLSEVVLRLDGMAAETKDGDPNPVELEIDRINVDNESLDYLIKQRTMRAMIAVTQKKVDPRFIMEAMYLEGFLMGYGFAEARYEQQGDMG